MHRRNFVKGDFVAAHHADIRMENPDPVVQVVSEAVVVVKKQNHNFAASRIALSTALALFADSAYSLSGSLSATMPMPACT